MVHYLPTGLVCDHSHTHTHHNCIIRSEPFGCAQGANSAQGLWQVQVDTGTTANGHLHVMDIVGLGHTGNAAPLLTLGGRNVLSAEGMQAPPQMPSHDHTSYQQHEYERPGDSLVDLLQTCDDCWPPVSAFAHASVNDPSHAPFSNSTQLLMY